MQSCLHQCNRTVQHDDSICTHKEHSKFKPPPLTYHAAIILGDGIIWQNAINASELAHRQASSFRISGNSENRISGNPDVRISGCPADPIEYAVYAAWRLFDWQCMNMCLLMLQQQKCLRGGFESCHFRSLDLLTSDFLAMEIRMSGNEDIRIPGYPVIRISGFPDKSNFDELASK